MKSPHQMRMDASGEGKADRRQVVRCSWKCLARSCALGRRGLEACRDAGNAVLSAELQNTESVLDRNCQLGDDLGAIAEVLRRCALQKLLDLLRRLVHGLAGLAKLADVDGLATHRLVLLRRLMECLSSCAQFTLM